MQYDTTLSRNELERMTTAVAPSWRLYDTMSMEPGHHAVYHLSVETPDGNRECYLKATPEGKSPSVDLEARLLAILDRHTGIPVPTVHGVVDEHETLPAPFVLLEAMPGATERRTELDSLSDRGLRDVATDTGRHLAELHALDAVDAFGFLTRDGPALHGESPTGAFDTVTVADPVTDWQERLRDWATETLADMEATRFADVASAAEPVLEAKIDGIEGEFDPALARIDNALENVLLEDGSLCAMLDWEFSIGATPDYDVVNVAWSLAGGPYLFAPHVPDRRDLVREALVEGYRERGSETVVGRIRANRECYELLSTLRSMVHLEQWYRLFDLGEQIDDAASNLRTELNARL